MPTRPPKRTLGTKRLICLLNQKKTETGLAMIHIAREIGIDSTIPSKLMANDAATFRNASAVTIEKVGDATGIDPRYFSDPTLGPNPDYRQFITRPSAPRTSAKQAPKRRQQSKDKNGRGAYSSSSGALPDEVLRTLETLYASDDERAAFSEVLADCRFPFLNQALTQGIIAGMRKGQRMPQYVDDALGASIDEEAAKRDVSDSPDGDDNSSENKDDAQ